MIDQTTAQQISELLRKSGGSQPVGGGPTTNTMSSIMRRPVPAAAYTQPSQQQGGGNNMSSLLRNGMKAYNKFNAPSGTGTIYSSTPYGAGAFGTGAVGTGADGAIGTLYGSGSTFGGGAAGVGADGAVGSLYSGGSGLGGGASTLGGSGAGGGGIAAFWPAAVALAGYFNEKSARSEGARDTNKGHYYRDLLTGNVINQDMKKRWGPAVEGALGHGTVSKGLSSDVGGLGQLGSGDIRGWAGNLHNGAIPKAFSGLAKMLRF